MMYGERDFGAASGALDPDSDEANEHAARFYEAIRNRTSDSDVKAIARNINFPEKIVKAIKHHVFLDEHDLGEGKIGKNRLLKNATGDEHGEHAKRFAFQYVRWLVRREGCSEKRMVAIG